MPTYLDLLPDELYQKIMTPLFTQCVEEVARRSRLSDDDDNVDDDKDHINDHDNEKRVGHFAPGILGSDLRCARRHKPGWTGSF